MSDVSITDLTAEAREWAPCAMTPEFQKKLLTDLADALEAAEQRAVAAEKEMLARELHHFEAEELLAAAQAVIAEVSGHVGQENTDSWHTTKLRRVRETLTQSPVDALEAVKAKAWHRGTLDLHATVSEYMPGTKPPVNPYRTKTEGNNDE